MRSAQNKSGNRTNHRPWRRDGPRQVTCDMPPTRQNHTPLPEGTSPAVPVFLQLVFKRKKSLPSAITGHHQPTPRSSRSEYCEPIRVKVRPLYEQLQQADPNGRHFCPLFVRLGRPPARRPASFSFGSALRPTGRPISRPHAFKIMPSPWFWSTSVRERFARGESQPRQLPQ